MHRPIAETAAEAALAEQFAALGDTGRAAAFAAFAAAGLPTRRDEAWHYTDLRAALKSAAAPAPAPDGPAIEAARAALAKRAKIGDKRLVFLDGRYVEALSDAPPPGLAVAAVDGGEAPRKDAVVALNLAFASGGARLAFAACERFPRLEIAHLVSGAGPRAVYSRLEVSLGTGAVARIVETFGAGEGTQRNALTLIDLGEGARCDWTTLVDEPADLHLENQIARLAGDAEFNGFALVSGGALARRQLRFAHDGPGARIRLSGLALIEGRRHADTTLEVEHAAPRGESREYFRHIVADQGSGVYQGKVVVKPHAQKTDGGMKSQAILLSPTAVMNNKPELEIFADDVVCGHGATVGALDAEQIFYLQARGLPRAQAEAMLLEAFGAEAIDRVEDELVAEWLRARMRAWLAGRGRAVAEGGP